jgi:hypothetical protein
MATVVPLQRPWRAEHLGPHSIPWPGGIHCWSPSPPRQPAGRWPPARVPAGTGAAATSSPPSLPEAGAARRSALAALQATVPQSPLHGVPVR